MYSVSMQPHKGKDPQNSVLLHICHLVCELQLSHMEANSAVLQYIALMMQTGLFWCANRARDFLENASIQAAITSNIFSQDKPSMFFLTFMEQCITRCVFYITQRDATYTMFFIIISALNVSGGISAHHQDLIKLYVQPWVLSRFTAVYRLCG